MSNNAKNYLKTINSERYILNCIEGISFILLINTCSNNDRQSLDKNGNKNKIIEYF
jgi:hypothetical protein